MKKILSIALAAGSLAASADIVTIEGSQIGSTAITSSRTNTIVAVAFKELSPTSQNICVSNIVGTAGLSVGDKVLLLNGSTYESWTLTETSGVNKYKYWAKNDANITMSAQGEASQNPGASADETRLALGTGIWLQRAQKPTEAFTFYIYGQVASASATTVPAGAKMLFGNPKGDAASPEISGMAKGDTILIPKDNGSSWQVVYNGTAWSYRNGSTRVTGSIPAIPAGTGAWYISKGKSDVTINW